MIKVMTFAVCAILAMGCNRSSTNQISLFKDDGHRKASIAFVPVIDNSESELPWSLSEEFTEAISHKLSSRGGVHIASESDVTSALDNLDSSCQPFGQDLNWMKKAFPNQEFVVFAELVDHYLHTHPNQKIAELEDGRYSFLDLTMRLRIVDLRDDEPKIVLQELIHHDHNIPKLFANIDYNEKHWGKTSFTITPVGLAHSQLIREVVGRLDDYISIAKSR
ncbi:MAG: hypothetical protein KDK50_02365 [Chlamydiia bacterium]|nr:hypothetical protein [Chlamydiia bacterium]